MAQVGEHLSVTKPNTYETERAPSGEAPRKLGRTTLEAVRGGEGSAMDAIAARRGAIPAELRLSYDNPTIQLGDQ